MPTNTAHAAPLMPLRSLCRRKHQKNPPPKSLFQQPAKVLKPMAFDKLPHHTIGVGAEFVPNNIRLSASHKPGLTCH
jgi:hypothetical protein